MTTDLQMCVVSLVLMRFFIAEDECTPLQSTMVRPRPLMSSSPSTNDKLASQPRGASLGKDEGLPVITSLSETADDSRLRGK